MSSPSAFPCPQKQPLARLVGWPSPLRRLAHVWQRGRAVNELKALSDAQLRDIGIERGDVGSLIDRELNKFRSW
jgi:uncharacterized protein YjiS (DUF1127 family)